MLFGGGGRGSVLGDISTKSVLGSFSSNHHHVSRKTSVSLLCSKIVQGQVDYFVS